MAFPTIPTVAAPRIVGSFTTTGTGTKTFPNLSLLIKNAGDLLIAIIVQYDGNSTNAEFSGWGGGFTEFADFAGTTTMAIGCAYKFSTGSETGTFTVTTADTSTSDAIMLVLSIAGAHASTPPEAGGFATGVNTVASPGSFNPAGWDIEDTLWIGVCGSGEDALTGSYTNITTTPPTNHGSMYNFGQTADAIGAVDAALSFRQSAAASEDVGNYGNDTSSARWGACTIAVRPAPDTSTYTAHRRKRRSSQAVKRAASW